MKKTGRMRRHKRITKKLKGDQNRPRLVVFRSKQHIYVQLVNDREHRVLCGFSTLTKDFKTTGNARKGIECAKALGKYIAEKVKARGIEYVAFDRGGYMYHGRIKAVADGIREGGLKV